MLLQDEQYVVKWLTQYGALTKTQVIRLLRDKPPKIAEKIIRNLKQQFMVSDIRGGYYLGADSMAQPDQRIILAICRSQYKLYCVTFLTNIFISCIIK